MLNKHKLPNNTAYDYVSSNEYDRTRFCNPKGRYFHMREVEQLKFVLKKISVPSKVLEVGCGTSRFVEIVAKSGHFVYAIDPSEYMIEISKRKCKIFNNVEFKQAEGSNIPYSDNKFDLVYSIRTLNQTESKEYACLMIQEMIRVTKPGGLTLIEFCNKIRPYFVGYNKAVRLSFLDIHHFLSNMKSAKILEIRGILFLSMTLFNKLPISILPFLDKIDRFFSDILPYLAARCYIVIEKLENELV